MLLRGKTLPDIHQHLAQPVDAQDLARRAVDGTTPVGLARLPLKVEQIEPKLLGPTQDRAVLVVCVCARLERSHRSAVSLDIPLHAVECRTMFRKSGPATGLLGRCGAYADGSAALKVNSHFRLVARVCLRRMKSMLNRRVLAAIDHNDTRPKIAQPLAPVLEPEPKVVIVLVQARLLK